MKVTIRMVGDQYEAYVPKKDMEEKVVDMSNGRIWGGIITLTNGWKFQMPDLPEDTRMPITVDARKLAEVDD